VWSVAVVGYQRRQVVVSRDRERKWRHGTTWRCWVEKWTGMSRKTLEAATDCSCNCHLRPHLHSTCRTFSCNTAMMMTMRSVSN